MSDQRGDAPRRPRVLHVWEPPTDGVDLHARSLVADQQRRGFDVCALAPRGAQLDQITWSVSRSPVGLFKAARQLARVLDDFDPDVVHLHSTVAGLLGRLVVRGRRPTLFTPHAWSFLIGGPMSPVLRAAERALTRWTTVFIAVGEVERDIADRLGAARAECVPNGIDLDRFTPPTVSSRAAARADLDLPADAEVVVCVGRIARQKGQDILLAAWPSVVRARPNTVLVLAGGGPDPADGATQPVTETSVRRLGDVSDVVPVLHAADLVVQPSRWEGLSYATIEALAVGLPIVGSDIPAIREVTAEFARYVTPDDVPGLSDAIIESLRHPDSAPSAVQGRRERAEGLFDVRRQHDRIASITIEVAGRG